MNSRYDVAVIGAGAGGGIAALELARRGLRVLVIERGEHLHSSQLPQSEERAILGMEAFDQRTYNVNGSDGRLYISGQPGGGSALYGAVLMRPSPEDFIPGRYYSDWIERSIWEWPIDYDDLRPWYGQVEQLMEVCGDRPSQTPHVGSPEGGYRPSSVPLQPISQRLANGIERVGYTPVRLPLAIDFDRCLQCAGCPGYVCPTGARPSTLDLWHRNPEAAAQIDLITGVEVERMLFNAGGRACGLRMRTLGTGEVQEVRADLYVIAAGAIGSPLLLLRSGYTEPSGMLGANYMYHAGAVAVGLFRHPTGGGERFIKQVGFTDLYFGGHGYRHKLGYAQTLPSPGPETFRSYLPVPLPLKAARGLSRRTLLLSGSVEDLPQESNRISLGKGGQGVLRHKFHPYDLERSRWYGERLKQVMQETGARMTIVGTADQSSRHTAHQVGTLRFGTDPTRSVLTSDCRLHNSENVWVADGSFMPTSLGVGPALTIMANAMRVAAIVAESDVRHQPGGLKASSRTSTP